MKVKDITKRINYGSMEQEVFVQHRLEEPRKLSIPEIASGKYGEANRTVTTISLSNCTLIIHYN